MLGLRYWLWDNRNVFDFYCVIILHWWWTQAAGLTAVNWQNKLIKSRRIHHCTNATLWLYHMMHLIIRWIFVRHEPQKNVTSYYNIRILHKAWNDKLSERTVVVWERSLVFLLKCYLLIFLPIIILLSLKRTEPADYKVKMLPLLYF